MYMYMYVAVCLFIHSFSETNHVRSPRFFFRGARARHAAPPAAGPWVACFCSLLLPLLLLVVVVVSE
jgi:hypothetical protein